jgi:hypothetical protein
MGHFFLTLDGRETSSAQLSTIDLVVESHLKLISLLFLIIESDLIVHVAWCKVYSAPTTRRRWRPGTTRRDRFGA